MRIIEMIRTKIFLMLDYFTVLLINASLLAYANAVVRYCIVICVSCAIIVTYSFIKINSFL